MEFMWYCIINSHCKGISEKWVLAETGFKASGPPIPKDKILGLVERLSSGEWNCYTRLFGPEQYVAFEPSRHLAMKRVIYEIKKEVRSGMVLAGKPVQLPESEGAGVPDFRPGNHEQLSGRIRGRVQGDSE